MARKGAEKTGEQDGAGGDAQQGEAQQGQGSTPAAGDEAVQGNLGVDQPKPKVGRMRVTERFEAESLGDVAEHLGERASYYEDRSKGSKFARDRERSAAIAEGLREAERIVSRTTITG